MKPINLVDSFLPKIVSQYLNVKDIISVKKCLSNNFLSDCWKRLSYDNTHTFDAKILSNPLGKIIQMSDLLRVFLLVRISAQSSDDLIFSTEGN